MSKQKILIQIDSDFQASTFDSIVAMDAGVERLLTRSDVGEGDIESLVHGAMFTRGQNDLKSTALFFGGSDAGQTDKLVAAAKRCFFGSVRVSLMSDPNGNNTTAAAAVLCAQQATSLAGKTVTVMGTGPVGQRIAQLVAGPANTRQPTATIQICSRSLARAETICEQLTASLSEETNFVPVQSANQNEVQSLVADTQILFAAGPAGISLVSQGWQQSTTAPEVAVDVNAVPPVGIHGIDVMDNAEQRGGTLCFGAIGVGNLKMKIHRRCLQMLFESNDQTLETEQIYTVGQSLSC